MVDPNVATDDHALGRSPILLVEDDASQAMLVERVLRKARLANPLISFSHGDEAIAYLEGRGQYDDRSRYPLPILALLDLHVPGKSGLEILTWLRGQRDLDHVPAVVLSGSAESEDIDRAFDLGAESYLVKPVAFDALLDTVGSLGLPWMILRRDKDPRHTDG
jgi:CheY-like chemotaxis protein